MEENSAQGKKTLDTLKRKSAKSKSQGKSQKTCEHDLLINYYDTPCGLFSLDNCPFRCKDCGDCKELFQGTKK